MKPPMIFIDSSCDDSSPCRCRHSDYCSRCTRIRSCYDRYSPCYSALLDTLAALLLLLIVAATTVALHVR